MWSATGQATVFILIIGIAYSAIFIQKNKLIKCLVITGLLVAILYNLMIASRTIFIIMIIVFALCYLIDLITENKFKAKHIIVPIMAMVMLFTAFNADLIGIKSFYEGTNLYYRLNIPDATSILEDKRFEKYQYYFSNMLQYPFGGLNMRMNVGYAHNLWLDAYDSAGIIPFTLLLLFFLIVIFKLKKLLFQYAVPKDLKLMILGVIVAMLMIFMVEPILDGVPWLFILFCLFVGMVDKYIFIIGNNKKKL